MWGGDWSAWIILFLIWGAFGGGWGNGFGGGFGGANGPGFQGYATRSDINEGFALNNLQSGINSIQNGICDSTYSLTNAINNGFHGVDTAMCNLGTQLQQCCCDNARAIDGVNPMDRCFAEAAAAGVTCVLTGPGSANAIGGQMVALKTRGTIADQMTLRARRP